MPSHSRFGRQDDARVVSKHLSPIEAQLLLFTLADPRLLIYIYICLIIDTPSEAPSERPQCCDISCWRLYSCYQPVAIPSSKDNDERQSMRPTFLHMLTLPKMRRRGRLPPL